MNKEELKKLTDREIEDLIDTLEEELNKREIKELEDLIKLQQLGKLKNNQY